MGELRGPIFGPVRPVGMGQLSVRVRPDLSCTKLTRVSPTGP